MLKVKTQNSNVKAQRSKLLISNTDQSRTWNLEPRTLGGGFGTKQLGDARDIRVIKSVLNEQGTPFKSIVSPQQTHSTNVHVVESSDQSVVEIPDCDGVITSLSDVVLTIITADCVPIIYEDAVNRVIGISHQGWKGTLNKLPQIVIKKMVELGSSPKNIKIAIGPAINQCCYEVSSSLASLFSETFLDQSLVQNVHGGTHLNLYKANYSTLVSSGIIQENIDFLPFCTYCDKSRFWSYRRDGDILGEMLSFVVQ